MSIFHFIDLYISRTLDPVESAGALDTHTVQLFKDGDEQAAVAVFEQYHKKLYNFVLRYIGDPEEAQDLVHDAFILLLKNRHKLAAEKGVRRYLYTIAVNLCKSVFRKRTTRKSVSFDHLQEGQGDFMDDKQDTTRKVELKEAIMRKTCSTHSFF